MNETLCCIREFAAQPIRVVELCHTFRSSNSCVLFLTFKKDEMTPRRRPWAVHDLISPYWNAQIHFNRREFHTSGKRVLYVLNPISDGQSNCISTQINKVGHEFFFFYRNKRIIQQRILYVFFNSKKIFFRKLNYVTHARLFHITNPWHNSTQIVWTDTENLTLLRTSGDVLNEVPVAIFLITPNKQAKIKAGRIWPFVIMADYSCRSPSCLPAQAVMAELILNDSLYFFFRQ